MKWFFVTLTCLSLFGGLIECSPFSPFSSFPSFPALPEKVLLKHESTSQEEPAPKPVSSIPAEVVEKIVAAFSGALGIGKNEKVKVHTEQVGSISDAASKLEDVSEIEDVGEMADPAKELINEDSDSEATNPQTRKRRAASPIDTKVRSAPHIEDRYRVERGVFPSHPSFKSPGKFVKGHKYYDDNAGPVVIVIKHLDKLSLAPNDCENCGNEDDDNETDGDN